MPFTNSGKHIMLDAFADDADFMSLHSSSPGTTGINELTGGSPAYARKAPTFSAASGGEVSLSAAVEFDVPPGATVAFVGFWQGSAPGVFLGYSELNEAEEYAGQGTFTVDASAKLVISDPA